MLNEAKTRSMTFTGCWTCKSRKIRCDERPIACGNCAKKGVVCGGYDIKLQWMLDPFDQSAVTTPSNGQGRRSIALDRNGALRYSVEDIDGFLQTIDSHDHGKPSSRLGPFSIFPIQLVTHERNDVPVASCQDHSTIPLESGEIQHILSSPDLVASSTFVTHDIPMIEQLDSVTVASSPLVVDEAVPSNTVTAEIFDAGEDEPGQSTGTTSERYSDMTSVTVSENATSNQLAIAKPGFTPSQGDLNQLPMQHIQSSLFGDTEADFLMHHYNTRLADVLQPIQHPQNPYRSLYIPTVLEGVLIQVSNPRYPNISPHSALHHAMLASSAFHIWNFNRGQSKYREIGALHRIKALRSLQTAVSSSKPAGNYKSLLMAMLTLVTIGVISGEDNDFAVHLLGTMQLRNSRKQWKVLSGATRQLNEISAFLILLARTVSFRISPSPWIDSAAEVVQSGCNYDHMYGITSSTAAMILETCRLAELISQPGSNMSQDFVQDDLLEACEALGDRLLSWTLEYEVTPSILPGDGWAIFEHHAKAWHHAALIYYYRRIQGYDVTDLVQEVDCVVNHMLVVENIKAKSLREPTSNLAPITWPMFIASCEAIGSSRDVCRRWWEKVEQYRIANLSRQWDVVQMIWAKGDELQETGHTTVDWTVILKDAEIDLLPV